VPGLELGVSFERGQPCRKFLAKASSDRLYVAWRLSLYGLRRGDVLGLRWSDIDLRARTLTVNSPGPW
jgi:integrase